MDVRKVQLVGISTLTVSLPREWTLRHKVSRGSKLSMVESPSGSLIISPLQRTQQRIVLNLPDDASLLSKLLTAAYLRGYDTLVVKSNDAEIDSDARLVVRRTAKRLMGLQVVREDAHTMELDVSAEPRITSLSSGMERMTQLVKSVLDVGLSMSGESVGDTLSEMDEDADKLTFVYSRWLRKTLMEPAQLSAAQPDDVPAFDALSVFKLLERCVDHAVAAATALRARNKPHPSPELQELASKAARLLEDAVSAFVNKDAVKAAKTSKEKDALRDSFQKKGGIGGDLVTYHLTRIIDYSSDIAEIVLDEGYGFMS